MKPNQKDIFREWLHHHKKINPDFSRREFLEKAADYLKASVFVPSILSLITKPQIAHAANGFNSYIAYDFSGGAGWTNEIIVRGRDGNFLQNYNLAGVPAGSNPRQSGTVLEQFGAPIWASSILGRKLMGTGTGVNLEPGARANLKVVVLATRGTDDSPNPNICSHQAGKLASLLTSSDSQFKVKSGVSEANSLSGAGRARTAEEISGFKPAQAASVAAVRGLISMQQGALSPLSSAQMGAFVRLTKRLNDSQKTQLAKMTLGQELGSLAGNAAAQNMRMVAETQAFDARTDTALQQAFEITAATLETDARVIQASQLKLVLDGAAPILVRSSQQNRFDYHDGSATTWKTRHQEAFDLVIRDINAFFNKGQSGMFHINTDGAIRWANGSEAAQGDGGEFHAGLLFILSMNGAPAPKRFQVGHFTEGQAADNTTDIAKSGPNEGHAVFANLVAFQGRPMPAEMKPASLALEVFNSFKVF